MSKKKVFDWLLVLLWCSVIFIISGIPHLKTDLGVFDLILRKCAHITEYAVLYFLFFRALNTTGKKAFYMSAGFCILYAISDEIHQYFVPGRIASPIDVVFFDLPGILISSFLVKKFYYK